MDIFWDLLRLVWADAVILKNALKEISGWSEDMETGCVRWVDGYTLQDRLGLRHNVSTHICEHFSHK